MNLEVRKKLVDLISEYGNSMSRIQAEKELIKLMEARAVAECDVTSRAFRVAANAYWRDTAGAIKSELEEQIDLLELIADKAVQVATVRIEDVHEV